jgi:hypothetical protein
MKQLVIMPGGFHPFHAGHMALYKEAQHAFPDADVFVAATNDTSQRPFPFKIKQKLAQLAGVPANRFVQVKSPFKAEEITQHYKPEDTVLIFVRSEKDKGKPPMPGGTKKDGSPAYLQPLNQNTEPMMQHAYMAYLPTVEFAGGMTSATEIRNHWPGLDLDQKRRLIMQLYPASVNKEKLQDTVIKLLDTAIGTTVTEAQLVNDPESGVLIRPSGGMGTWNEDSLKSSLIAQFMDIAQMLKHGNYRGVEYSLYKAGSMRAKIEALARFEEFKQKQGRRPIARGREIDIGESTDYLEEKSFDNHA